MVLLGPNLPLDCPESANRLPTVPVIEQSGPSPLLDLPLQCELGASVTDEPPGDRKHFVVRQDALCGSDRTEFVDQAHPQPRIEAQRPDFGDQLPATDMELALE